MLTIGYCAMSAAFSLIAFAAFGINRGIPEFLTVRDVLNLAKAVIVGELLTGSALFSITRLDGIPRSVPAIHALTLAAGLFTVRLVAHLVDNHRSPTRQRRSDGEDAVVLIGITKLSVLYMKLVETVMPRRERIVALLDDKSSWVGRTVNGVPVFGLPADLERLIEDMALHGVQIDRVVVAGEDVLSAEALMEIRRVCIEGAIDVTLIPELLGTTHTAPRRRKEATEQILAVPTENAPSITLPRYFGWKRLISLLLVAPLIVALLPLMLIVMAIAFLDVGFPIFFWQQRLGLNGRTFLLYKLRTLREPFDWHGERIPDDQRLSKVGRFIRKLRLDEFPQLLNILVGDMAFIGPRPLLLRDQPPSASVRLMVRPGISGWAQVNGGVLLSPVEKGALDEWYVRHASIWLDLRIILLTLRSVVFGDRKSEAVLDQARQAQASCRPTMTDPGASESPAASEHHRIIFINRFFYPDQSATSQMLTDLAFHLARQGRDVHVFASRQRYDDPRALLLEAEQIDGVTIHRVTTTQFGRRGSFGRVFDYLSFYKSVRKAVLAFARAGDVLVAKTDPPLLSVLAARIAKRRQLRLVNWLQDLYPEVAAKLGVPLVGGILGRRLMRWRDASLQSADANVVIGERMAETVRARGIEPPLVQVVHNWCDDEDILPVAHAANPFRRDWQIEGQFVVGYSGNLGRGHEFETVLAAAEALRDEPRITFLFIGGGKKLDALRGLVTQRSLEARFRFLPYQNRAALKYSLGAADVHVVSLKPELEGLMVPSKFYGIAAAGRPAIAITDADGEVAMLVRKYSCGAVIEPGQGALLAETLSTLMKDRDRLEAMGHRARAMLDEHFSRRQAFAYWDELFDRVVGPCRTTVSTRLAFAPTAATEIEVQPAL